MGDVARPGEIEEMIEIIVRVLAVLTLAFGGTGMAQDGRLGHDLAASAWLAEEIEGRRVADGVQSTLEFAEPGQVAGLAGCNRYFGPLTLEGDRIALGNLASTRMMCPENQMDQEQRFLRALEQAKRFALGRDAQILEMFAGDGAPVLRFTRVIEK